MEILVCALVTQLVVSRYEFILYIKVCLILRIYVVLNGDNVVLGILNNTNRRTEILFVEFRQVGIVVDIGNELFGFFP